MFVICRDSDNFWLWLRGVQIQYFLQTSEKAHSTMPVLVGPHMQQAAKCQSQLLIHQNDNEEFRAAWAEDNKKEKKNEATIFTSVALYEFAILPSYPAFISLSGNLLKHDFFACPLDRTFYFI